MLMHPPPSSTSRACPSGHANRSLDLPADRRPDRPSGDGGVDRDLLVHPAGDGDHGTVRARAQHVERDGVDDAGGAHHQVGASHGIAERRDGVASEQRLQGADGVGLGDRHRKPSAASTRATPSPTCPNRRRPPCLPAGPVACRTAVRRPGRAPRHGGLPGAVPVVEERLGAGVVHATTGCRARRGPPSPAGAEAARRLLRRAEHRRQQVGALLVGQPDQVRTVVEQDVRPGVEHRGARVPAAPRAWRCCSRAPATRRAAARRRRRRRSRRRGRRRPPSAPASRRSRLSTAVFGSRNMATPMRVPGADHRRGARPRRRGTPASSGGPSAGGPRRRGRPRGRGRSTRGTRRRRAPARRAPPGVRS